jgi:hypothetical protein
LNKKVKQQMKELKNEARKRKNLKKQMSPKERFEFQMQLEEQQRLEKQQSQGTFVNVQDETEKSLSKLGIRTSNGRFSCDNCLSMRPGDYCAIYKKRVHKSNYCREHEKIPVVIYYGGSVSPR